MKGGRMHAVVGRWRIDLNRMESQQAFLRERIVPRVRNSPGFLSGHWSKPAEDGIAHSFILFEDEATATAFAASVQSDPHNRGATGVEGDELSIVEISVTA
jgi:hypothetical protein